MSTHGCRVLKVEETFPIDGADRIHRAVVAGLDFVTSKEIQAGDTVLLFDSELKLSDQFIHWNNLSRNPEKNKDTQVKGFVDENGKIRAQSIRGVKSMGLLVTPKAFEFTGYSQEFEVGMIFDELNGVPICSKFIGKAPTRKRKHSSRSAIYAPEFHMHVDTERLGYYIDNIKKGDMITITNKYHGTSARYGYHKVIKKRLFGLFSTSKYEYLTGTRRVILTGNKSREGDLEDQYRYEVQKQLEPYLEKGMTIYGEIVGYTGDSKLANSGVFYQDTPIMPPHNLSKLKDKRYVEKYGEINHYAYGCQPGEFKFIVYRITVQSGNRHLDYTPMWVDQFCKMNGLNVAKTLVDPFIYDGDKDRLMELVEGLVNGEDGLQGDHEYPNMLGEGVVIRVDGKGNPDFYKAKSHAFYVLEGIVKEEGIQGEDE